MTFLEFLSERKFVRSNSQASKAGTTDSGDFVKSQISNLEASAKEAGSHDNEKPEIFRSKALGQNVFGDKALTDLARKREIDVHTPVDLIKAEMEATKARVKNNIEMILNLSNEKRHQNGGKM
jgi:hypothetical protein